MKNRTQANARRQHGIGISNIFFLLIGMGVMGLVGFFKSAVKSAKSTVPIAQAPAPLAEHAPWGQLEYTPFALKQPEGYLSDSTNQLAPHAWYFERTTPAELMAVFNSLDASPATRQTLLNTNYWSVSGDAIVINPTPELVLGLGQPARQRIYSLLGGSMLNLPQYFPFRFRADAFDRWFAQSRLGREKLELVRSLTYTNRGGSICLADINLLQQKLAAEEFRDLCESLYSEHCLFLSLRVDPTSDVAELARYWGRGGREQEVRTILKSLAQSGGGRINVAYLLPSFARLRLYTFAQVTNDSVSRGQDCFWSALSFFKSESEAQLASQLSGLEVITRDYQETREAPRFGDIILLVEYRKPVHACVYIADNIVFTKNGLSYHQPWVLMKINDVLARYATDRRLTLSVVRLRAT